MASSRNQTKSKGKCRSNKENSNTNKDSPINIVESFQSQCSSNPQSLDKLLDQVNPKTENFDVLFDKQVERFVMKKLEGIYKEAHMRLISYGYKHNEALNAILINGHAFGDSDVLTNIMQNSLSYIKIGKVLDNGTQDFGDLRMMVDYSLTKMISLQCQVQPNLTKRQALWCLFLSNFHLGVGGTKNLPCDSDEGENKGTHNSSDNRKCSLQKDYGGDFKRESKSLTKINLTPSLACQLRKNVTEYANAYCANMKVSSQPPQIENNSQLAKKPLDRFKWEESCLVDEVLDDFCTQNDERPEGEPLDPKIATILSLVDQIKEVKKQVKEQKEWAQSKVIQAAEKLNNNIIELRKLRMERVKIPGAKDKKLETKKSRVQKLSSEMEDALKKAAYQANLAVTSVIFLEEETAKIRAEMESFKLNAMESDKLCLESGKKERKLLKKIMALEKENNKLEEETTEEKNKTLQFQQQLTCLKKAQEDIELMWRQEMEAKEQSITQMQHELRVKEEDEVRFNRKQEALYQKIELDRQRCKDDIQRLEQEIYNLLLSLEYVVPYHLPAILELQLERSLIDILATPLLDLSLSADTSEETYSRTCLICTWKEACVVFLPCAHQVLCASCNEGYCRNVGCRCPCCQAVISQTVWVYGMSS